jgi:hypothetical protein
MPDCHQCPHDGTGSRECLKCAAADIRRWQKTGQPDTEHNHGKTHVSIDEVSSFIPAPAPAPAPTDYDAAIHFIRSLCGMRMIEREIVFARIMGEEFPSITARLNSMLTKRMTVQGVHFRAKKALSDPAFAELFKIMLVKQQKRKPKTKGPK